ncbi:MAG: type III pantothenate kinase [Methylococcaceae bacterium]|nr:type III pantothenate kinase [Methylococcaceae bacterium]
MTEPTRLLVDAGNSRIKWALAKPDGLDPGAPFRSEAAGLTERLEHHWATLPPPTSVTISNVAGVASGDTLHGWITRHWGLTPYFARVQAKAYGITTRYEQPERLGVDRWLALVAARANHAGALCVVDCGTAITLDFVDDDGIHQGGLIAPGLGLMRNTLAQRIPGLSVAPAECREILATATATGISSGARQAVLGLIERGISLLAESYRSEPLLILTGGDGGDLATELRVPCRVRPHLVLEGLLILTESAR